MLWHCGLLSLVCTVQCSPCGRRWALPYRPPPLSSPIGPRPLSSPGLVEFNPIRGGVRDRLPLVDEMGREVAVGAFYGLPLRRSKMPLRIRGHIDVPIMPEVRGAPQHRPTASLVFPQGAH